MVEEAGWVVRAQDNRSYYNFTYYITYYSNYIIITYILLYIMYNEAAFHSGRERESEKIIFRGKKSKKCLFSFESVSFSVSDE